jgi:hypothetical protein
MELDRASAEELRRMAPALCASHLEGLLECMATSLCYKSATKALLSFKH